MIDQNKMNRAVAHLKGKKVLMITTSNRWSGSDDIPKTTQLAEEMAQKLYDDRGQNMATIMDITKMHIYHCEGNVSDKKGNSCGVKGSTIDHDNPTGNIRCWASFNHKDDELHKVANAIFEADVVLFFISTRWGQANAFYQKLIERLNWIENRWSTLEGDQLMKSKEAGCVVLGHNWNTESIMENQMQVYRWYGFQVPREISYCWQWTSDVTDESAEGYLQDPKDFKEDFGIGTKFISESYEKWIKSGLLETAYEEGKRKPTPEEIEMCKSPEGFNQVNHCKALGLIPREDGTKTVSKKYGGKG
jgi:multimeric flavodoxin WrbA